MKSINTLNKSNSGPGVCAGDYVIQNLIFTFFDFQRKPINPFAYTHGCDFAASYEVKKRA